MHERIIVGLMLVVALVQFLPITGVVSVERLAFLYGIEIADPNLEILMRHRAILFGLLGAFIAYAAFHPTYQPLAFVAGGLSIAAFFWLSFIVGDFNDAIRRANIMDIVASLALVGAIVLYFAKPDGE